MKKNKKISEENKILIFEEGENFAFSWHGQSFGIAADVAMFDQLATWANNKAAFLNKIKEDREEITEETAEDRAALYRRKFPPKQAFKNKRKKSKK